VVSDKIMVVSFLMIYIGSFLGLHALFVRLLWWLWDSDWFWLVATSFTVVILMMNLY
jgi:hypothetical protein